MYPVRVKFGGGKYFNSYTEDGRDYFQYKKPTLFSEEFYFQGRLQEKHKWRAEKGSHYWHIDSDGQLFTHKEEYDDTDDKFFRVGNYFSTREEAMESDLYKAYKR